MSTGEKGLSTQYIWMDAHGSMIIYGPNKCCPCVWLFVFAGEKLSPEELDDLTKEADPQGTNKVSYDDFLKVGAAPGCG